MHEPYDQVDSFSNGFRDYFPFYLREPLPYVWWQLRSLVSPVYAESKSLFDYATRSTFAIFFEPYYTLWRFIDAFSHGFRRNFPVSTVLYQCISGSPGNR